MKIKLFAVLAVLSLTAFLEAQAHHNQRFCKKKQCTKLQYFDYDRCDCRCLERDECHRRQEWDRSSCSCKCPWYRSADNCINWEEFDDRRCRCYCPFSRKYNKCPPNRVWNYENCHCECNKSRKDCAIGQRLSRSQCKCVPDETFTTVATTIVTTTPIPTRVTTATRTRAHSTTTRGSSNSTVSTTTRSTSNSTSTTNAPSNSTVSTTTRVASTVSTTTQSLCPNPYESFSDCGTRCPLTCRNKDNPPVCIKICVTGCFCIQGYVRNDNGICIPAEQCPALQTTLAPTTESTTSTTTTTDSTPVSTHSDTPPYSSSTSVSTTESTTESTTAQPTTESTTTSTTVSSTDSTVSTTTRVTTVSTTTQSLCPNAHESYSKCGCTLTCRNKNNPPVCAKLCVAGCFCIQGYVRNDNGICIPTEQCPALQTTLAPTTESTTSSTTTEPTTESTTSTTTQSTTASSSSTPSCSFGTQQSSENPTSPISPGVNVDGSNSYVAYYQNGNIKYPGAFLRNSQSDVSDGFYYALNGAVLTQDTNVFYLTQTPGCNCQFLPIDSALPANANYVTVNENNNTFGIGSLHYNVDDIQFYYVGRIEITTNTFVYVDLVYNYANVLTIGFNRLVCTPVDNPSSSASQSTTVSVESTVSSDSSTTVLSTEDQIASIQASVNNLIQNQANLDTAAFSLITSLIAKVQTLLTDTSLPANVTSYLNELLTALQNLNAQTGGARRKRQANASGNTCDSITNDIEGIENDKTIYAAEISDLNNLVTSFTNFLNKAKEFNLVTIISDLDELVKNKKSKSENNQQIINNLVIKGNLARNIQTVLCSNTTPTTPETTVTQPLVEETTTAAVTFDPSTISDADLKDQIEIVQSQIAYLVSNLAELVTSERNQITATITQIDSLLPSTLSGDVLSYLNSVKTALSNILNPSNSPLSRRKRQAAIDFSCDSIFAKISELNTDISSNQVKLNSAKANASSTLNFIQTGAAAYAPNPNPLETYLTALNDLQNNEVSTLEDLVANLTGQVAAYRELFKRLCQDTHDL